MKFGYSDDCDGCNAAQLGHEAYPNREGCQERIRQAMMDDDMGQQRLQEAEQRLATRGGQLAFALREEAAQEGKEVGMTAMHSAGNTESSKSQSAETSSRMEDVSGRGNVERRGMGPPDDGSREMATVLMSLGVAPVIFKVAELCCNKFGDAFVEIGFERGLVVACATGRSKKDEEQMKEVERRVMDEEPVLLIGSPLCWTFGTLIELTRVTGSLDEVKHTYLLERCTTPQVLLQDV